MSIKIFVLCKNEIKLAPFFIDYWQALSDDVEVFVYDGLSNDGTRELFAKYDWIHVIDFEPDALDDCTHVWLKNNCWKPYRDKCDFVMVGDFDETITSYRVEELKNTLEMMKREKYSIIAPLSFNLIPDTFPEYEEGKFLHELCEYGFNDFVWESKPILFDPKLIDEINFIVGGHVAHPTGNVKWYMADNLFLIHAKYIGFDFYHERLQNRIISGRNKHLGLNGEKDKLYDDLVKEFESKKNLRFNWCDIKAHFDEYYVCKNDWSAWGGMKR